MVGSKVYGFAMTLMKFLWVPFALIIVVAMMSLGGAAHHRVSSAEAHRLVEAGARLVDVRASFEFANGHLPGAINVPLQHLDKRMGELEPKDKEIVVYCQSGGRSQVAFEQLKSAGFSKLYDLGPMSAW
jgi:rhodanese-related sulfurtransferase